MKRPRIHRLALALVLTVVPRPALTAEPTSEAETPHRSPIALALSADGTRLLTANQTAGSVSLVDTNARKVLAEVATGDRPAGVAIDRSGRRGGDALVRI